MIYFGYGSLVNRQTRKTNELSHRATLNGWQRQWRHQAIRPWSYSELHEGFWAPKGASSSPLAQTVSNGHGVCALTIEQADNCFIDGVLVEIDESQLPELDQREAGYNRIKLPLSAFTLAAGSTLPPATDSIVVYKSSPAQTHWASIDYPVPLSYVDCVLAGFYQQFGVAGARRFMQTTKGWNRPLMNDRKDPLYPRAILLTTEERPLIDALLAEFTSE